MRCPVVVRHPPKAYAQFDEHNAAAAHLLIRELDSQPSRCMMLPGNHVVKCASTASSPGNIQTKPVLPFSQMRIEAGNFRFITIQAPDEAKDPARKRLARSHAVKEAHRNKRKLEQETNSNFRILTSREKPRKPATWGSGSEVLSPLFSLSGGALDPFETLAVDSCRLQKLLRNGPFLPAEK